MYIMSAASGEQKPATPPSTPETETKAVTLKSTPKDEVFEELYSQLMSKIGDLQVNSRTTMLAMRYGMELVEATKLKGEEQKQMVLKMVRKLIIDAPISDEKEKLCLDLIDDGIMSQTIDLIIDATRGNLSINSAIGKAVDIAKTTNCCGLM